MLVEAQSLAKRFGGAPALDGVSFQASAGEIVVAVFDWHVSVVSLRPASRV